MVVFRWFDPEKHHRCSIRLKGFDYTRPGAYFITICSVYKGDFFGIVKNGNMILNEFGRIADHTWNDLPNHNRNVSLDKYVVMPNHFHGILVLHEIHDNVGTGSDVVGAGSDVVGAGLEPAPTTSPQRIHGVPEIVRQFKTFSARRINEHRKSPRKPVWQRNYYEHIIRPGNDFERIRKYIANNPHNF